MERDSRSPREQANDSADHLGPPSFSPTFPFCTASSPLFVQMFISLSPLCKDSSSSSLPVASSPPVKRCNHSNTMYLYSLEAKEGVDTGTRRRRETRKGEGRRDRESRPGSELETEEALDEGGAVDGFGGFFFAGLDARRAIILISVRAAQRRRRKLGPLLAGGGRILHLGL